MLLVTRGVIIISKESRADYFKEYRKTMGQFSVYVEKDRLEQLSHNLKEKQKTKTDWLREKIDEEIGEKK